MMLYDVFVLVFFSFSEFFININKKLLNYFL